MRPLQSEQIAWRTIEPRTGDAGSGSGGVLDRAITTSTALRSFLQSVADEKCEPLLIVNDPYRATQTRPALVSLAAHLRELRFDLRFYALVATGTHAVDLPRRREFETQVFSECGLTLDLIDWHESKNAAAMIDIAGVRLNQAVANASHILAIGSVEPHYFAGVTGAHKTITIGCMAQADIEANHAHALSPDSRILRTRGNPVFDGVASVVNALARDGKRLCAINEVICNDAVVAAAVGDPLTTLDDLIPSMRQCFVYDIEKPVDILHLRVPPPLNQNLYQAEKALKNNGGAVRNGGGILLDASCNEGVGTSHFIELLRAAPTFAESRNLVSKRGYRLGDHKAVKLRHLTDPACEGVHVAIASNRLRQDELADTGLNVFETVGAAMEWLMRTIEPAAKEGLIIDDAGNLCPRLLS